MTQLSKQQVDTILKNAPMGADKTKILDGLITRGYELEGVDTNLAKADIARRTPQSVQEKPNYLQRVGQDIKQGFQSAGQDINANDGRSAFSKGISAVSDVASAVASPLAEAPGFKQLGEGINKGIDTAGNGVNYLGEKLANLYTPRMLEKISSIDPEIFTKIENGTKTLADLGNIANTILMGKGGAETSNLIKDATVKTGTAIRDATSAIVDTAKTSAGNLLPDSATIMNKVARLKPSDAIKFEQQFGQSHGQYLAESGNFKAPQEIINHEATKFTDTLKAKDTALERLPGTFKDGSITDLLNGLAEKAKNTSGENIKSPYLKQVMEWQAKNDTTGLTMEEMNLAKRLYEKEVKLGYGNLGSSINPDAVKKATYIDSAVREFQDRTAKSLGFDNLPEVNKQIQKSKFIIDKLGDQIVGKTGLNGVSLTDWVMLSGGNPTAVAGFLTKKFFGSKNIQAKIAEYLNKGEVTPTVTPSTRLQLQSPKIELKKALPESSQVIPKKSTVLSTGTIKIPANVRAQMKTFIDYVNDKSAVKDLALEADAARIAEDYGIIDTAKNKTKRSLANVLSDELYKYDKTRKVK